MAIKCCFLTIFTAFWLLSAYFLPPIGGQRQSFVVDDYNGDGADDGGGDDDLATSNGPPRVSAKFPPQSVGPPPFQPMQSRNQVNVVRWPSPMSSLASNDGEDNGDARKKEGVRRPRWGNLAKKYAKARLNQLDRKLVGSSVVKKCRSSRACMKYGKPLLNMVGTLAGGKIGRTTGNAALGVIGSALGFAAGGPIGAIAGGMGMYLASRGGKKLIRGIRKNYQRKQLPWQDNFDGWNMYLRQMRNGKMLRDGKLFSPKNYAKFVVGSGLAGPGYFIGGALGTIGGAAIGMPWLGGFVGSAVGELIGERGGEAIGAALAQPKRTARAIKKGTKWLGRNALNLGNDLVRAPKNAKNAIGRWNEGRRAKKAFDGWSGGRKMAQKGMEEKTPEKPMMGRGGARFG